MRSLRVPTVICLVLFATGCLQSVHPLFDDEELIFDRELVGIWKGDQGGTLTFERTQTRMFDKPLVYGYFLTQKDADGKESRFVAGLGVIGGRGFLDFRLRTHRA